MPHRLKVDIYSGRRADDRILHLFGRQENRDVVKHGIYE